MRDQPRKNGDEHAHDDEDEPDGEHGPGLDGFEPPRIDRRCYVDEMRHTRSDAAYFENEWRNYRGEQIYRPRRRAA